MIQKLIRIYTPFIMAISVVIHGVLFLNEYEGIAYNVMGNTFGYSTLLIFYLLATNRKMCKWWIATNVLLLLCNVTNTMYYVTNLRFLDVIYICTFLGIAATITSIVSMVILRLSKY